MSHNLDKDAQYNLQDAGIAKGDVTEVVAGHIDIANEDVSDVTIVKANKNEEIDEGVEQVGDTQVHSDRLERALEEMDLSDTVADTLDDANQVAKEKVADLKQNANEKLDEVKEIVGEKTEDFKEVAAEKLEQTKDALADAKEKATDLTQGAGEKLEEAKANASQKIDDAKEKAIDLKNDVQDKMAQVKSVASEKLDETKVAAAEKIDEAKEKVADLQDGASEKLDQVKEQASEKLDEVKATAIEKLDAVKEKTADFKESAQDKFADLKDDASQKIDDIKEKANEFKDNAGDKIEDAKASASEKLDEAKEKIADIKETVLDKVDELKAKALDAKDNLLEKIDEIRGKDSLQDKADSIKQSFADLDDGLSSRFAPTSFISRELARFGAYVGKLSQSEKSFDAVDLDSERSEDAFRRRAMDASGQAFGAVAGAARLASKVLPEEKTTRLTDGVFGKIAQMASAWAEQGMQEFAPAHTDSERDELAAQIANQNRALATLGGVTGLAGLLGIVADAFWLLLVALRTVYQTALVYDKPLTGKEGIDVAYSVLSAVDLQKMQEKQMLQMGLSIGSRAVKEARKHGVRGELKVLGARNEHIDAYAKQIDALASKFGINIDRFNGSFLGRILPLTSVGVGMYYNGQLIEEVIGLAKATFIDSTPVGLIEDKSAL